MVAGALSFMLLKLHLTSFLRRRTNVGLQRWIDRHRKRTTRNALCSDTHLISVMDVSSNTLFFYYSRNQHEFNASCVRTCGLSGGTSAKTWLCTEKSALF